MAEQTASNVPQIRFKGFEREWEEKALGEVMAVGSVKRIHQSDWTKTGVRFLRARDIVSAYKNEDAADVLYISQSKYDKYSALSGKVEIGDLLVTGVGTIGIPYLIRKCDPVYFKDGNIIWFKNHGTLNGDFFYYSFTAEKIQSHIKESAGTGTVGTYTISSGKNTPLTSPKLEEQQKIGEYFRELDRLIGLHQRKHDKLVTLKKAMLQRMFPQPGATTPEIRFRGFSGDWVEDTLKSVAEITTGFPFKSSDFNESAEYLVVTNGNIQNELTFVDASAGNRISVHNSVGLSRFILRVGDILVTMDGSVGRTAKVREKNQILAQRVGRLVAKSDSEFLYQALNTGVFLEVMAAISHGGTIKHISLSEIGGYLFMRPSDLEEQQKIGTYFRTLDSLISKHATQLQKLQQIKSACMEKMFV